MSQHVADKVALLRAYDSGFAVFGASRHQWRCDAPATEADLSAFEAKAGIELVADHRTFLTQCWASGAGPYYGLLPLPAPTPALAEPFDPALGSDEPLQGAVLLADQGCGMTSVLVLNGPNRGQVWFDMRESGGGMSLEAPSFDAWMNEWADRSLTEAAAALLPDLGWDSKAFIAGAADAIERLAVDHEPSPTERQYPLPPVLPTLGYLRVHQGRFDEALAIFERAAEKHPQDAEARLQLERARVSRARGDLQKCLQQAHAGLDVASAWFATRTGLWCEARDAAFALGQVEDALAACEGLAQHTGAVQDHLMVAWHRVMLEQPDEAAAWIVNSAKAGVGSDPDTPLQARVDALLHGGFLEALAGEKPAGAHALEERLKALLQLN